MNMQCIPENFTFPRNYSGALFSAAMIYRCDSRQFPGYPGMDDLDDEKELADMDPRNGIYVVHGFGVAGDRVVSQLADEGLPDVAYMISPVVGSSRILTVPTRALLTEAPDLTVYIVAAAEIGDWLGAMTDIVNTCALNFLMIIDDSPLDEFKRKSQHLTDIFDMTMPLPFPDGSDLYESAAWSVRGALELIVTPGLICLDFVDVMTATRRSGFGVCLRTPYLSTGQRAELAYDDLVRQLDTLSHRIDRPSGALLTLYHGIDLRLAEFDVVATLARERGPPLSETTIVVGSSPKHREGWLAASLVITGV